MTKRTMPVCCDLEQYKLIEKYAKNLTMKYFLKYSESKGY